MKFDTLKVVYTEILHKKMLLSRNTSACKSFQDSTAGYLSMAILRFGFSGLSK